jgi:hypothetical protein
MRCEGGIYGHFPKIEMEKKRRLIFLITHCSAVMFLIRRANGAWSSKLLRDVCHVMLGGQAQAGDVEFLGHGAWLWLMRGSKIGKKGFPVLT